MTLTSRPGPEDVARLNKSADLIGADRRFLVSQTPQVVEGANTVSCDLAGFLARLV